MGRENNHENSRFEYGDDDPQLGGDGSSRTPRHRAGEMPSRKSYDKRKRRGANVGGIHNRRNKRFSW